eukprot:jgi/Picsp_1/5575/NSC_02934-R1_---NA---
MPPRRKGSSARDEGGRGETMNDIDSGNNVLDFMPGAVCGGVLTKPVVAQRSRLTTEEQLSELKESREFKAWQRGEDVLSLKEDDSWLQETFDKAREWIDNRVMEIGGKINLKIAVIMMLLCFAVVPLGYFVVVNSQKWGNGGGMKTGVKSMQRKELLVENIQVESADAIRSTLLGDDGGELPAQSSPEVGGETCLDESDVLLEMKKKHDGEISKWKDSLKELRSKIGSHVDALEAEVRQERLRASEAEADKERLFSSLDASRQYASKLESQIGEARAEISTMEKSVRLSVKHSSLIQSVDLTLIGLEIVLLFGSGIAYLKTQKLKTAAMKARKSYLMAYRRQQGVLAAAEDVYKEALQFKSEQELQQPGQGIIERVPESIRPWVGIIGEMNSFLKSSLRLNPETPPVEVFRVLVSYMKQQEVAETVAEPDVKELEGVQHALQSAKSEMAQLQSKLQENIIAKGLTEQKLTISQQQIDELQARLKTTLEDSHAAQHDAVSQQNTIDTLTSKVEEMDNEKNEISAKLEETSQELNRVVVYAKSLEKKQASVITGPVDENGGDFQLSAGTRIQNSVQDHLTNFEAAMPSPLAGSQDIADVESENLVERLSRIRKLLSDANEAPQVLLSPSVDLLNDKMDAKAAIASLPLIGDMHISSSDDEEMKSENDEAARALETVQNLTNVVQDYISILSEFKSDRSNELQSKLALQCKRAESQRGDLERALKHVQEAKSLYRDVKNSAPANGFVNEKGEVEYGNRQLKAHEGIIRACERERNSCKQLEAASIALNKAVREAKEYIASYQESDGADSVSPVS